MTLGAAALVVAIAAGFVVHARAWAFLCDDAFISFRYARNLVDHGALVFNVGVDPPEFVEGYTNFGWVIVLGLAAGIGIAPHVAAPVLTQLAAAATVIVATGLVLTLRQRPTKPTAIRALHLVTPALLVSSPNFMVWSHGGLETALSAALVVAAWWAFVRRRVPLAAALAAAAVLTRPDTVIPLGVFVAIATVVDDADWLRRPWRKLAQLDFKVAVRAVLWFAVPVLGHLLWRRAYYGAWLPNTWTIKAHGALLRDSWGVAYLQTWVTESHVVYAAPLLAMLRARHLPLVGAASAVLVYGWWVGGDFMAYGRFYIVATVAVAALVGWLLADVAGWLGARWRFAEPLVTVVGISLALVSAKAARNTWQRDRAKPSGWLDGRWEGVTAMDRFAQAGLRAGAWMHDHLPPQTLISVGAAGAVPYASGLPIVDAYGLVDPAMGRRPDVRPLRGKHARPGHQLIAPAAYIKERDPDLLCHVGYRGATRPSERRAHRAFRRGYTWACVEPDPADPDAGYYCCRRPVGRVVGPFGVGEKP